jgi:hypothetical protein
MEVARRARTEHRMNRVTRVYFPFPLRSDFLAVIEMPERFTAEEAERVCAYVRSLAVDEPEPSEP